MAISLERPAQLSTLDAVNIILEARGIAPVSNLDGKRSAVEAANTLATTSFSVQTETAWNFNTDEELKLSPNLDGQIYLPETLHLLKPVGRSFGLSVSDRGGRLYDRRDATFVFKSDVYVKATHVFPFAELPSPAKWYIAVKAAFQVGNQKTPGDPSARIDNMTVEKALSALQSYDKDLAFKSLRDTNPHFKRQRGRR